MNKRKLFIIPILIVFGFLVGCQGEKFTPVEIVANTETCYNCHMGIEKVESAAEALLSDGTPRLFDDIGCMVKYLSTTSDEVKASYVHDALSGEWISFDTAYFVQNSENKSPMSYGIMAYKTETDAKEQQQAHGGDLYTSKELLSIDVDTFKQPMEHMGH